jgi:hypothetical protein
MDNVTIETVTCEADVISAALSDAYGCDVDIMGFITMMGTIDCPDFVCPCDARRRRGISSGRMMLSTPSDPTSVEIIYQFSPPPESPPVDQSVIARNLESALGGTVNGITILSTKASAEWVAVKSLLATSIAAVLESSLFLPIVIGVVAAVVLLTGGGVFLAWEYGWCDTHVYAAIPTADAKVK